MRARAHRHKGNSKDGSLGSTKEGQEEWTATGAATKHKQLRLSSMARKLVIVNIRSHFPPRLVESLAQRRSHWVIRRRHHDDDERV